MLDAAQAEADAKLAEELLQKEEEEEEEKAETEKMGSETTEEGADGQESSEEPGLLDVAKPAVDIVSDFTLRCFSK